MGGMSLHRRKGARRSKKATDEGAGPAPRRGDNAMQWVHFCGNDAPALKGGEVPGDGSTGVIRVRRRSKAGKCLETGLTV
ncbi:hypothetical protein Y032_0003g1303 [Ancylostoma ceylanicum]|uniref:Uncharacterized protein n=1 Tax=Ancylostoma ceylanicum TaxID=53326 RepID=A0A016VYR9_9BILA|nr:hypothetical protein Y032_0003g1303 [Ancylostoma ceylanicum]